MNNSELLHFQLAEKICTICEQYQTVPQLAQQPNGQFKCLFMLKRWLPLLEKAISLAAKIKNTDRTILLLKKLREKTSNHLAVRGHISDFYGGKTQCIIIELKEMAEQLSTKPSSGEKQAQNYIRKGATWEICYKKKSVYVDGGLKGLPLIAYLLTHPHENPISALDLEQAVFPPPAGKKTEDLSEDLEDTENNTGSMRITTTGQTVNTRVLAKADIDDLKALRRELEDSRDKMQTEADIEEAERNIKHIENEIARRQNKDGKPRPIAGDPFETARVRVFRQVKTVKEKLNRKDGHKELYNHLHTCLKIKTYCSYTPEPFANWKIL